MGKWPTSFGVTGAIKTQCITLDKDLRADRCHKEMLEASAYETYVILTFESPRSRIRGSSQSGEASSPSMRPNHAGHQLGIYHVLGSYIYASLYLAS